MSKEIIKLTENKLKEAVKGAIKEVIGPMMDVDDVNEELWEFIRLPKKRTKLQYDIFVDNNEAYKSFGHPLCLYVDCDSIKVPITIERRPRILTFINKNEFDFSDVYDFINKNLVILHKLANKQITDSIFFHLLKTVAY